MNSWQRRIPFKVDIAGIIEIMGSSLYSRADTPVRELIQNAHDAIMRRRSSDLGYLGRIDVRQNADDGTLQFEDDGVGLSPDDAEQYLGTLGIGITGVLKRGGAPGEADASAVEKDSGDLIGQFGIGLFSGFMLADRMIVESRRTDHPEGVRWEAGPGTDIELSRSERETSGTCVTLTLKAEYRRLAEDEDMLEGVIREFADFLGIPIHLNDADKRVNVINAPWLDATPDHESIELELESCFGETPLDIIPIRMEKPVSIAGALYVSPQRVPGFSESATVMVTVRRMVISRRVQDLVPDWALFVRGVLELHECSPTASREDLVRNEAFAKVRGALQDRIFEHFEQLAENHPDRMQAILNWHRYTFAGAALEDLRLRNLLRKVYTVPTSAGPLTLNQLLEHSSADPILEPDAERVVWYNTDRRQERWVNQLFAEHDVPCVHAFRSFEESLLAQIVADENQSGTVTDLRITSATSVNFAEGILNIRDMQDAGPEWSEFLASSGAKILTASFHEKQPVMAFLNERYELHQAMDDLKKEGNIPSGFQRLIDNHFDNAPAEQNEVVLNRSHPLVERVLSQRPGTPLSSVLRLLVLQSLNAAGASGTEPSRKQQLDDLDWIAEALWGREE